MSFATTLKCAFKVDMDLINLILALNIGAQLFKANDIVT